MTDAERLPGFYWIQFKAGGDWEPAQWTTESEGYWSFCGYDETYLSSELAAIDERRIEREPVPRPSMVGP